MDSSPSSSSITGRHIAQALPYDFFESPDKKHELSEEARLARFTQSHPETRNPFASPELPHSPVDSLISLRTVDFTQTSETSSPSTNLRPVTDFTLVEYFIHEMPDLPIFFERFKGLFTDTWDAFKDTVICISHTEWRKVCALVWSLLKNGAVLLWNICSEWVVTLRHMWQEDLPDFLELKIEEASIWLWERVEDVRNRFVAPTFREEYQEF